MDESTDQSDVRRHQPVLLTQAIELLAIRPGGTYVDATVGLGGHSIEIARRLGEAGRLIAIDQDPESLAAAKSALAGLPVTFVAGSFANLDSHLARLGIQEVDGILADLGVSSPQLDRAERGFSFRKDGPLDMRMNPDEGESAREVLCRLNERELATVFWELGEERYSRRVASVIVARRKERPLQTTGELADLVRSVVPRPRGHKHSIDPATRVFQALRIFVNDELGALDSLLSALPRCLRPAGRAVIISFHSLEDRRVKYAFREQAFWKVLAKKPIEATDEETRSNPRSRSAKMRGAERIIPADETKIN